MILALMIVLEGRTADAWALISNEGASAADGEVLARTATDEDLRNWANNLTSTQIARLRVWLDSQD